MIGLRPLLAGCLDYAGMFPPARLTVGESARRFAAYRGGPQAWLLGRFVCPAERLGEVHPAGSEDSLTAWPVSAVVSRTADANSCLRGVADEVAGLAAFNALHAGSAEVDAIEVRMPAELAGKDASSGFREFLAAIDDGIRSAEMPPLTVYVELPVLEDPASVEVPARRLTEANRHCGAEGDGCVRFAAKFRLGGADDKIPTPSQMAAVVATCAALDLSWKATAGLHQPLGRLDPQTGGFSFGFLSLFVAAVLASTHALDAAEIEDILREEDPRRFHFDSRGLRWRDRSATAPQIEQARRAGLSSFGSCSFEEPCQGLQRIGLLEGAA